MRFIPFAVLFIASCSKEDLPPPDIAQTRTMIREVIEKYHAAGDASDLDTMKSLLASDVTMFRLTPDASTSRDAEEFARGVDQCMEELGKRLEKSKGLSRRTFLASVTIEPIGDMAVVTYVASLGTLHAPITAVFRRMQGKWFIKHLHESWYSIVK